MGAWHVAIEGVATGPLSESDVAELVGAGRANATSLVWRKGMAEWQPLGVALPDLLAVSAAPPPLPPSQPSTPAKPVRSSSLADRVADLARVERLEGFSLRELLSDVFKPHSSDEIERHMAIGLAETTPPLADVAPGWPKPWLFVRLFSGTVLLFVGFLFLLKHYSNPLLLPALLAVGSLAAPAAIMLFFFEMNSPRNVSLHLVLKLASVGGLVSIGLSLALFDLTRDLKWIGPPLAGLIEEIGKLLTVSLLTRSLAPQRYPFILNGMLFGAAVGAGFAAFESAGYAFVVLIGGGGVQGATDTILVRGMLSPFAHVVWTALTAGALYRAKLDAKLQFGMLTNPRVLHMLLWAIGLHAVWNFGLINPPFFIKYWILGFIAWVLVLSMLQTGYKQVKLAQLSAAEGGELLSGTTTRLRQVSL